MNQTERLLYLIKYLLSENVEYSAVTIPQDKTERFNLYRSLVNIRSPKAISDEYLKIEDEFLQEELSKKTVTDFNMLAPVQKDIYIWQGDITTLKCDAIVNAANAQMLGCFAPCHACIDNCIHTFSGVRLRLECDRLMRAQGHLEKTGEAKLTPAYNLPCNYILHTVGPIINNKLCDRDIMLLSSCYLKCLEKADENKIKSIAFCCISTGVFSFPNDKAAEIAVKTVKKYKEETGSSIKVIFNVFLDKDKELYEKLL